MSIERFYTVDFMMFLYAWSLNWRLNAVGHAGGDTYSSEVDLGVNPDGSKLYATWTQWVFQDSGEEVIESNAEARRVWRIDDFMPADT